MMLSSELLSAPLLDHSGLDLDAASRVTYVLQQSFRYDYDQPVQAAEALAGGYGVCQDFAHVMLAVCHLAGLPARYVSGHLLGQGGTHAWVEVIVPSGAQARAGP